MYFVNYPQCSFLPPQFFTLGLSSIWMIIAGGIAVVILPFILPFRFIKRLLKKYKKIVLFIFLQNVIIAILLGVFFFYKFYKPLYEDSYLFPQKLDPANLNKDYVVLADVLRDDYEKVVNYKYGLIADQIKEKIEQGISVYFIDIREPEEFNAGHIIGAKHIRYADLKADTQTIKKIFSLSEEKFQAALFVLYCHDGTRALFAAEAFNNSKNIKYLIGGAEALYDSDAIEYTGSPLSDKAIFGKKYQYKFQTTAADAIKIIKQKDSFIIDMRHPPAYAAKHIKGSFSFKFNLLPREQYEQGLEKILANKGKEFILIVNRYSELFYANLLILRLQRDHNFGDNKFHIVFYQFPYLEQDSDIQFEESKKSDSGKY